MVRWLVTIAIVAAIIGTGAYWLGPGVVPRSRLELLAFDVTGQFSADARLAVPDSTIGNEVRYPLVLAIRNTGSRTESPQALSLALPGWARLLGPTGMELESSDEGDELLHAYRFSLKVEPVEPGALPIVVGGLEGLSLVARLPDATCSVRWDDVPEFTKMPAYDPDLIAKVEAYYSLTGRRGRESGKLILQIDPASVVSGRNVQFDLGPTEIRRPSVNLPATGPLTFEGLRSATCGAPELRYELETAVWRTGPQATGRIIIVMYEGRARRWLFDLDGDGRIELEAWDGDGDGAAEAKRTASYRIPSFLLPVPMPKAADTTSAAPPTATADSTVAPQPSPQSGNNVQPDSIRLDSIRTDSIRRDSSRRARMRRDSVRLDSIRKDSIRKDSIRRDSLRRDTVAIDTLRIDTLRIDTLGIDTTGIDTMRIDTLRIDTTGIDTLGLRGPGIGSPGLSFGG
jgi:hypothetical protein